MRTILIIAGLVLALLVLAIGAGVLWYQDQASGEPASALEARYMADNDRFIDVAGARMRVREEGPSGGDVIILIHGFSFSLESWDGWAERLSEDYRVIRYDLLGHGLTGPDPQQRYAPQARAEFLAELMDALDVERASLAGNSLGGTIAWRFAAAYPDRIDKLILVDAGVFQFNEVGDEPVEPPAAIQAFLQLAPEAGVRQSLAFTYADPASVSDERVQTIIDMMRREGNGEAFIEHIRQFTMPDPSGLLSQITAPTLVMWGGRDFLIPASHGPRVAEAIANSQLIVYDDLAHAPHEDDPERTVADVLNFLETSE
ncbi:alpha/beta fold hydrolase [Hyphobacterium sp.]|uniref:alpha/beta fold hydrolase n=1 Tax=Hyphobacterium sp. TaxID=2004662 RepID=UPI0037480201